MWLKEHETYPLHILRSVVTRSSRDGGSYCKTSGVPLSLQVQNNDNEAKINSSFSVNKKKKPIKNYWRLNVVAYNPSYLGGGNWEDYGSRPTTAKN
jgi:hypothetical protein